MNIVCIYGSPQKRGNSATIANHLLDALHGEGREVKRFFLNDLDYKGCQGCNVCKTKLSTCVLKDDLEEVLEAVRETDVLIIASPVYYSDVTGQLKCFIDRTWSFVKPDYRTNPAPVRMPSGKTLVFIQTQGEPGADMHDDVYPKYKNFFSMYGFKEFHLIRALGVLGPGEVKERNDIMKLAEETAANLHKGEGSSAVKS